MAIRTQVREFLTLAISDLARRHRPRRGLRQHRARIEQLEARTLLTTYSVTNLNDAGAGSLRDAISQANVNSGADTISFGSLTGTISLTSGPLQISDSLSIAGLGADKLAISAGHQHFHVINIDDGQASLLDVSISGLTVRDGGDSSGVANINGAGIFSRENLTLNGVALLNNNAGPDGGGGGLAMFAGNLKMSDCTVAGNTAHQGGGVELSTDAVSGFIVNSTISGNQANGFGGGVLVVAGATVIRNCTITGNHANSDSTNPTTSGGGVLGNAGLLTLHNTIVAGNFWGSGASIEPDDAGDNSASPVTSDSSNNLMGATSFAGGLTNGVKGNIVGNNGSGTRDIATILNTTLASNGGPTQTHALVQVSRYRGGVCWR